MGNLDLRSFSYYCLLFRYIDVFEKVHLDMAEYIQDAGLPVKRRVLTPLFIHLPLLYATLTRIDFSIFEAFQCYHLS